MMGKHRTALAKMIESTSDPKMIIFYIEKDLKEALKSIIDNTDYELINKEINSL
jgi:hypothetical protein